MGTICSSLFGVGAYTVADTAYQNPEVAKHKETFEALGLKSREVSALFEVFKIIDKDSSGEISCREMLDHLGLEKTKFTKRVFSIMDEDGSGEIDFREFCVATWNYCTLGKGALILFGFDLYDNDSSGNIDIDEIELMLKEVYGKSLKTSSQAKHLMAALEKDYGNKNTAQCSVDKAQFSEFVRRNPGLLYPAFQLQQKLQSSMCGVGFWEDLAQTRIKLSGGAYVHVSSMIVAEINKEAFDQLVKTTEKKGGGGVASIALRGGSGIKDKINTEQKAKLRDELNSHDASLMTGTVGDRRLRAGVKAVMAQNRMKKFAQETKVGRSVKINPGATADKKPGLVRKPSFEKLRDMAKRKPSKKLNNAKKAG